MTTKFYYKRVSYRFHTFDYMPHSIVWKFITVLYLIYTLSITD